MRLFIDIGHPAHVHYFKHFARIMRERGNDILFSVRDKESTISLMDSLDFEYEVRGKGGNNAFTKLLKLLPTDARMFRMARKFDPDIMLSFASPYAALVAKLLGVPHIAIDDTEHARFGHILYRPFSDVILSPSCYMGQLHKRQLLFASYSELFHLHPNYFSPDADIHKLLKIEKGEPYVLLRFVAWNAHHDIGQSGFVSNGAPCLIRHLEKKCRVFISSEKRLENELLPYQLTVHPSLFHHVLANASLYIGEGSTAATESSVLGTPSIYVNSLKVGNCAELSKKYGLCYELREHDKIVLKADEILDNNDSAEKYAQRKEKMLREKIDPVALLVWFVAEWPASLTVLRDDPDMQYRFQ